MNTATALNREQLKKITHMGSRTERFPLNTLHKTPTLYFIVIKVEFQARMSNIF